MTKSAPREGLEHHPSIRFGGEHEVILYASPGKRAVPESGLDTHDRTQYP